jgi:hypothetical protein
MSADTESLHRSLTAVKSLEGPEEELVTEDSPIRHCLPDQSRKLTMAIISLLPCKGF